ncbi:GNAT family N-acetyltransferase [Deinococcus rubellus]|uniref:GNAT family N-acetyltransferase n=1 Tax=Deinococcus rubellus TaxID=1889240 RepID=A0ABY5YFX6_9DEIO|nr:GNAT family N-acetyltransferase [Deinococcus rubellus]UWX63703.1 GNAT family N-acetyltransferase [Deinococcus rubellus]
MNSLTFTLEPASAETLADLLALLTDRVKAAAGLRDLEERLAGGKLALAQTLILRSERGVEGSIILPDHPRIPLIPTYRADTPPDAVTTLARALRERAAPQQQLLLTNACAPLEPAPLEVAGWQLDSQYMTYATDLSAHPAPPDALAQAVDADRPDIRALLERLGRAEWSFKEDWTLIALPDASGSMAALGAVGPSGRPDWASIDLIGVQPQARGQGLGTRLHAHLLGLAAQEFAHHGGGTGADNQAMRRIFAKSGSRHTDTQMYFKLAEN